MAKKWYYLSVSILSFLIVICILSTSYNNNNIISINNESINSKKPEILPIARIIIPKIKLDNPLYNPNSNENTVEKNIMILDGSSFPTNNNSIIFLAAHSGTGNIAYFNDLDQLSINDLLIIQYKNYNYYYIIDNIFEEEKDGDIEISKTSNQQLVLTTCSKKNQKKQLVINSNFIKKEEITYEVVR